jgi:hypothetical protein
MFKAEKIELRKNNDDKRYDRALYLQDCYSLEINDVLICNAISSKYLDISRFQNFVCTDCAIEDCNPTGILTVRRQDDKILIIPCFDEMDGFGECEDNGIGNRQCPPHEWYDKGILIIEGEILKKLSGLMPCFHIELLGEASKEEQDLIVDWEEAVRQKPTGFMNRTF